MMAGEPDNLVLGLLREIRAKLEDHDPRFDEMSGRLAHLEQRNDEIHETMYTIAGFATHANVRHERVSERRKSLEGRIDRLEEKV
ncbi:hypothetical protein SAMN06297251_104101 [Fulvimarina manganoxydans]|uniref:Uncharacterized protein n=1 Tax=Fulvimarina manganoxydans TaxID=937218 RepID=A0A1W2ADK8_9HYPH|nr:hypothetical protein [Fulvimarina manganoxydans]SMC58809.1 hypothetical protein SAMN06297251_104101 [Fulvimarina manganoxydans]